MNHRTLRNPRRHFSPPALLGAVLLSCGLFLLLPLTRHAEGTRPEARELRTVRLAPPPPPPPVFPEVDTEPEIPEMDLEPMSPPEPMPPAAATDLRPPGPEALLAMGPPSAAPAGLTTPPADLKDLFTFEDLRAAPQALYVPVIRFPDRLARRGIREGRVVLHIVINTEGHVSVDRVVSASHPELVEPARKAAVRSRFSVSEINGRPVSVRGDWPIILKAP